MYQWVHFERVDSVLDSETDDDVYDAVWDVLEALERDPMDRDHAFVVKGTTRKPDSWAALLPGGYVISYRVYVRGIPPAAIPSIAVLSFGKPFDLEAG